MKRLREPIALGLALTIAILLAGAIVAYFKWPDIAALRPNELGDCLAGVSATLAFIWLTVAVFLQRKELQAQRDELRQSREVYFLQAEELKRTADHQKIQSEIMHEQLKGATAERLLREASEKYNRRQQNSFLLRSLNGEVAVLSAYKERIQSVVASLNAKSEAQSWPMTIALKRMASIGLLNSILGATPESQSGADAQNFIQNLHTLAASSSQVFNTAVNVETPFHQRQDAQDELDWIEQVLTTYSDKARDLERRISEDLTRKQADVDALVFQLESD